MKTSLDNITFSTPVLIYVPCYNCGGSVASTLRAIPKEVHDRISCLVVDNFSQDNTSAVVSDLMDKGELPFSTTLIRTHRNLGYSGSQKLAYSIATNSAPVEKVIMLHGDGQYPPELITRLVEFMDGDYALVNGYRSKCAFGAREETPIVTYAVIKALSRMESALTGCPNPEWHSGFVMYSTDFLRRVPLSQLSSTRHIDGEFILCAHALCLRTASVPIFKRYKNFEAFAGMGRIRHVRNTLKVIIDYRAGYYDRILSAPEAAPPVEPEFSIVKTSRHRSEGAH